MSDFLVEITHHTLVSAIKSLDADIRHLTESTKGDLAKLSPQDQKKLVDFSKAALELKNIYPFARKNNPKLPAYETLVKRV
ncbi:MAG: hypothetical protein ACK5V3_14775 [Bdellovibrionales bacterium]